MYKACAIVVGKVGSLLVIKTRFSAVKNLTTFLCLYFSQVFHTFAEFLRMVTHNLLRGRTDVIVSFYPPFTWFITKTTNPKIN